MFYLLQVNDSLFPLGSYSHSMGLETYIQKGIIYDEATAAEYIDRKLRWGLAYTELLAARLAYEYAEARDWNGVTQLEEILSASRLPMEQRDASRKMGSRFVKTIQGFLLPPKAQDVWSSYQATVSDRPVTHCCVYGIFCAALGIELQAALAHYLYSQTSAIVTNCVKAVPLSQSAGQKLLSRCHEAFEVILKDVMRWTEKELCLSVPGFDLRGMQHERLYSRLYMS